MVCSCRAPPAQLRWYRVTVHTSDLPDAGTDADVYIALHGSEGGYRRLLIRCIRRSRAATPLAQPMV